MKQVPVFNVYYLLCYAWDHAQERDAKALSTAGELSSVQDLLGKVLASGTNRLLRRGIDRGYVERRDDLAGIRGKLVVGDTAKRALRARSRAACEFEELSPDILLNRILRSSLDSLRRLGVAEEGSRTDGGVETSLGDAGLAADVHAEVLSAYHRLAGVSVVPLRRRSFGLVQIDQNRRLYRFLLDVCRLILECQLVGERQRDRVAFHDFRRDEARMWRLFEAFATGFFRKEQRSFEVNRGGRRIKWSERWAATEADEARIPVMEADLILESRARRIVLDTKYYAEALGGRHGAGKLRSGNLYQLLSYVRNREATVPPGPQHEGILLYPQGDEPLRIDVRLEGFRIQARTVDLNQEDWRGIHDEMLGVLE